MGAPALDHLRRCSLGIYRSARLQQEPSIRVRAGSGVLCASSFGSSTSVSGALGSRRTKVVISGRFLLALQHLFKSWITFVPGRGGGIVELGMGHNQGKRILYEPGLDLPPILVEPHDESVVRSYPLTREPRQGRLQCGSSLSASRRNRRTGGPPRAVTVSTYYTRRRSSHPTYKPETP